MINSDITVINIPQLKDNYSYVIKTNNTNEVIIIDPAESKKILIYLKKNQLILTAILLTHHHNDHTAGVKDILNHKKDSLLVKNEKEWAEALIFLIENPEKRKVYGESGRQNVVKNYSVEAVKSKYLAILNAHCL